MEIIQKKVMKRDKNFSLVTLRMTREQGRDIMPWLEERNMLAEFNFNSTESTVNIVCTEKDLLMIGLSW
jgi:hypothetical protein